MFTFGTMFLPLCHALQGDIGSGSCRSADQIEGSDESS